jgi:unsaturated rhamnogalacturonyl hydrolase
MKQNQEYGTFKTMGMIFNKKYNIIQAKTVARLLMINPEVYATYTTDLGLIGLLHLYDVTKESKYLDHVLKVWEFREEKNAAQHNWKILFVCLHFETYLRTGNEKYVKDFVDVVNDMNQSLPYDESGAVCHLENPEKRQTFVDLLQGYAIYNARAGYITGNSQYFDKAIKQYTLYRETLRDKKTGLWHQGKNWGKPGKISPGFWNRGQGWTLAGMVESLCYMPKGHPGFDQMKKMLIEYAGDLLNFQDERGMWHQLTNDHGSYAETSGTAMIVHYCYKAMKKGWLDAANFRPALAKAVKALGGFITKYGQVLNTSYGTGPLQTTGGYRYRPAPPNDPHAPGTMIMGLTAPENNFDYTVG